MNSASICRAKLVGCNTEYPTLNMETVKKFLTHSKYHGVNAERPDYELNSSTYWLLYQCDAIQNHLTLDTHWSDCASVASSGQWSVGAARARPVGCTRRTGLASSLLDLASTAIRWINLPSCETFTPSKKMSSVNWRIMQMYMNPLGSNKGLCTCRTDKISLSFLKYQIDRM